MPCLNKPDGFLQPGNDLLLAQDGGHFKNPRAGGFAGEGHTNRLGDFSQLEAGLIHYGLKSTFQIFFGKALQFFKLAAQQLQGFDDFRF